MTRYWMVRPFTTQAIGSLIEDFIGKGYIGIGWSLAGDLKNLNFNEIKARIKKEYVDNYNAINAEQDAKGYGYLSLSMGVVNPFVNLMKVGDIVIVPSMGKVHIFKVTSDYYYDNTGNVGNHISNFKENYPANRRNGEWIKENIARSVIEHNFPELDKALKVRRTFICLDPYKEAVENLVENKHDNIQMEQKSSVKILSEKTMRMIEIKYQLRPDLEITANVPDDLTKQEARRLSDYFRTVYFK